MEGSKHVMYLRPGKLTTGARFGFDKWDSRDGFEIEMAVKVGSEA